MEPQRAATSAPGLRAEPSRPGDGPAPQRHERAQPLVAQVQPTPNEHPEVGREERMTEEGALDPGVARDRAAEKAGQQDGAEDGAARKRVEREAGELEHADSARGAQRIAELGE